MMIKLTRPTEDPHFSSKRHDSLARCKEEHEKTGSVSKIESDDYRDPREVARLLNASHGKCAWCEQHMRRKPDGMPNSDTELDHYAPKVPFWWLAFDWHNLLPLCGFCNKGKPKHFYKTAVEQDTSHKIHVETAFSSLKDVHAALRFINPFDEDPSAIFTIILTTTPDGLLSAISIEAHNPADEERVQAVFGKKKDRHEHTWNEQYDSMVEKDVGILDRLRCAFLAGDLQAIAQCEKELHLKYLAAHVPYSLIKRTIIMHLLDPKSNSPLYHAKQAFLLGLSEQIHNLMEQIHNLHDIQQQHLRYKLPLR